MAAGFEDCGYVVIMDGDGEDDPADLPRFLATMRDSKAPIVLAHRAKRSEGLLFRAFYIVYKLLFRQLTGQSLSFGNYCAMTNASARRLAFMPILWNSLPATCLRSKLPYTTIPVVRGRRYAGEAKMRFVDLILHGMQAITTFSDTVLVRLSLAAVLAVLAAIFAVVMVRFWEPGWIVPGWASNMVGFLVLSLVTILFGLLSTSLLALQERCNMPLIPFLHSEHYIRDVRKVWPCQ
ncbi:dolichol-phosphate mannosyltransferase [Paramagnetospirillum magnetotacticum MS-1]|uniref:Dolichol-phosphate mannosyltransferase n=1 Tax=Paramagnetospirillum magnetotacticum MS-1 TaxID=272627 RepID=A0A0C2YG50_PARME|nr:dolichol-phosphate mannosyltransferase [Paramagnetospirillum magnetotacticum MS-1]